MSCSVVWLKDDFRTSYNQAINALIEDENKEKKIIYIYEKKELIFYVKLSNGGLLNL